MTDAPGTDETVGATLGEGVASRPAQQGVGLDQGAVVGRYVVLSRVGAGGMGVVYAAYDPELDRKVALKLLHADPFGSASVRERGAGLHSSARKGLLREAQAMARLSHPNVITVHDVGEHQGRVYLAMEFVEGTTLRGWRESAARHWRSVLSVFVAAGRGLAAAHDKGLVHRDFKPDNVMVSSSDSADGSRPTVERVRVMDFGLARPATKARWDALAPPSDESRAVGRSSSLLDASTQHGSIAGTPAYMAPEQHLGLDVGPAADQFSFCVALWEALYGQRPFAGSTLAELALNVTEGNRRAPPAGAKVPRWVRRVCERGLASDPDRRFESMRSLLAALQRGHTRARMRKVVVGVGCLAMVATGGDGYRRYDRSRTVASCEAEGASIEAVWNDDARARLRAGILASGVDHAATTADKVMPWLDRQAQAWQRARTQTCLDNSLRQVWSDDLRDRSQWCLDERRLELEALVDALFETDRKAVNHAVKAAASLHSVDPCRDAGLLERVAAPPSHDREAVHAVRADLSRVGALRATGAYDGGLALARECLKRAETLAWAPLTASARLHLGSLLQATGSYEEAEAMLQAAYFEAAHAGATEEAIAATNELVFTVGSRQARYAEAIRWFEHGALLRSQLPASEGRDATSLHYLGSVRVQMGQYDEAAALNERARAMFERTLGPDHPLVATSLNNSCIVGVRTGQYAEAKRLCERAIEIREKALGKEHPAVAESLINLANVAHSTGDYDEAEKLYRNALVLRKKALGKEHHLVARALSNIATNHLKQREYEEAKAAYDEVLAILDKRLGAEHPEVAVALSNLASVHRETGAYDQARVLNERALAIWKRSLGDDHPRVAAGLNNLANTLRDSGAYDEAEPLYRQALAIWEKKLGDDHPHVAHPLLSLAKVAMAEGRFEEAVQWAERALEIRESADVPRGDLAATRFILAQALAEAGTDPDRAVRLAEQARDGYRDTGSADTDTLVEVETWLAERSSVD